MYHIKLHIVVVGDDSAASVFPTGYSISTIENLVNDLNGLVSHAEIYFDFNSTTDFEEIRSTQMNTDEEMHMERERLSRKHPDKITVIFRDHYNTANYSGGGSYNVTLAKESMKLPTKVVHELGHYFHLAHTFPKQVVDIERLPTEEKKEEAKELIKVGKLIDIKELIEKIRSYVEDEGHAIEDGLKALEVYMDGDRGNVEDTPYDFGAKIFDTFAAACANNAKIDFKRAGVVPWQLTIKIENSFNLSTKNRAIWTFHTPKRAI